MPAASNKLSLSIQYADPRLKDRLTRSLVRKWVASALPCPAEITIRFVDAEEGRMLNREYRGKDYATNVLTFTYDENSDDETIRADIVLCTDILVKEAETQNKPLEGHAAHLIIHGVLHAQGYDHENETEAEEMEAIEIEIMARLGLGNPYAASSV
jgi:probable rRNA maturation factor